MLDYVHYIPPFPQDELSGSSGLANLLRTSLFPPRIAAAYRFIYPPYDIDCVFGKGG